MSSEDAIRLEALKCQNLCCQCHLEETILRENGIADNSRSYLEREKLNYINQLKIKYAGCAICKFWDVNLIRFFDMDHLNPENKTEAVSRMVKDNKYTLDNLIKECNKCRVLCRHCHIIHTSKQKQNGVSFIKLPKINPIKIYPKTPIKLRPKTPIKLRLK